MLPYATKFCGDLLYSKTVTKAMLNSHNRKQNQNKQKGHIPGQSSCT